MRHAPTPALRALESVAGRMLTPALVIDLDAVEHNIDAMVKRVGDPRRWRPHLKTTKQSVVIESLLQRGVRRFKVATPAELELALRVGKTDVDVVVAYPLPRPHLEAVLELARNFPQCTVSVLADGPAHLRQLTEWLAPKDPVGIMADVDLGMGRTGNPPEVWHRELDARGEWPARGLVGLHGYDGHRRFGERDAAWLGYDALLRLARACPATVELITSGTHSYAHALAHEGLGAGEFDAQVSPGTIVFSDRRSEDAAEDLGLRQAAFVATTVISRTEDRITLDAGSKGVTPDVKPDRGSCEVLGHPELVPRRASEEHLPCDIDEGATTGPLPQLGDVLLLVPDHVCTTVNLHREALYVRGATFVRSGPIEASGHRPSIRPGMLALALLAAAAATGCQNERQMSVDIILPADQGSLAQVDNVSMVLGPEGVVETFAVDGLDFELQLALEPNGLVHDLELYLAEGTDLLAFGRSAPFALEGPDIGLALYVGPPGVLSTYPEIVSDPDPSLLAANARGRGALIVDQVGNTTLLNHFTYELEGGEDLEDPPAAEDGGLFATPDGRVLRIAWETELFVSIYDPGPDTWTALPFDGDIQERPGAAHLVDPDDQRLYLLGGGDRSDAIAIDLSPTGGDDPALVVSPVTELELDDPRAGASAIWIGNEDDATADAVVFGGDDVVPLLVTSTSNTAGEPGSWTGAACAQLDPAGAAAPGDAVRVLCLGGIRSGDASADGFLVELADGEPGEPEILSDLLPVPIGQPVLFFDAGVIYAQGAEQWVQIQRDDLTTQSGTNALRATGGASVTLVSGATFLLGGAAEDGTPLDRWQVFIPAAEN